MSESIVLQVPGRRFCANRIATLQRQQLVPKYAKRRVVLLVGDIHRPLAIVALLRCWRRGAARLERLQTLLQSIHTIRKRREFSPDGQRLKGLHNV